MRTVGNCDVGSCLYLVFVVRVRGKGWDSCHATHLYSRKSNETRLIKWKSDVGFWNFVWGFKSQKYRFGLKINLGDPPCPVGGRMFRFFSENNEKCLGETFFNVMPMCWVLCSLLINKHVGRRILLYIELNLYCQAQPYFQLQLELLSLGSSLNFYWQTPNNYLNWEST